MPMNAVRDAPPSDVAANFSINVQKMETPSDSSQSISKAGMKSPNKSGGNTIIKYQEVSEEVFVEDEYSNSDVPLLSRVTKLGLVRTYLT